MDRGSSVGLNQRDHVFPFSHEKMLSNHVLSFRPQTFPGRRDSGESMWVPGGLFQAGLAACALKQPLDSAGSHGRELRKRPGFPKSWASVGLHPGPDLQQEAKPFRHLPKGGDHSSCWLRGHHGDGRQPAAPACFSPHLQPGTGLP